MPCLIYFSTSRSGGLADYAQQQVLALAEQGTDVHWLHPRGIMIPKHQNIKSYPHIDDSPLIGSNRLIKAVKTIARHRRSFKQLQQLAKDTKIKDILFSTFFEYFSPFWAGMLKKLNQQGHRIAAVVHDPVRDAIMGPMWFHQWSIGLAYKHLDCVFLHQDGEVDTGNLQTPTFSKYTIPHGPYPVSGKKTDTQDARAQLGLPPTPPILLSFGHIRDNKNLHLAIKALAANPEYHLLIAGQSLSSSQKSIEYYKELAEECRVSDRIHWHCHFIKEEFIHLYFSAANFLLLTYSSQFHSASGVLNLCSAFQIPCIASAGNSPLKTLVKQYHLGLWIEPDNLAEMEKGLKELLSHPPSPDWKRYREEQTWEKNAQTIIAKWIQTEAS